MPQFDFEIGIIGGGPGGSALASYLAKAGISCIVFEQEHFPRHHVGEALVPASNRVFQDLDVWDEIEELGRKKVGPALASPWFGPYYTQYAEREQPGVNHSYTFHVDRSKFDLLLLQCARKRGAEIHEGARVQSVDFSEVDRPCINYVHNEKSGKVHVHMVIDASGRKTLLGNQLKLRLRDEVFDQYAIYSWFEGYDRSILVDNYQDEYTFSYFLPIPNSWVWQIPITDTITSIGVVTQKEHFARSRKEREAFFWDCIEGNPQLAPALRQAKQIRPFTEEGDYSYAMEQICGDNFLLIGDAARFVDPIFSTGVSIALNSARFASADLIKAVKSGDFSKQSFQTYETTVRRGTRNWYELISIYYRLFMAFNTFLLDERYRPDLIKLLQGDVYDEEVPEVLQRMKQVIYEVEQDEKHPWYPFLGKLTSHAFSPAF